ncbi:RNA-directed DNA polymerase, eukaryota, reverse transcriptase zinc-binding domain protein [Tanacetum coccineum]
MIHRSGESLSRWELSQDTRSSAGNKLPKGVPVAKGFHVGKEFNYQPMAPSAGSNGGGNCGETSSKAGPSKDTNVGASVATIESHVYVAVVYDTCKKVCHRWKWTSNGSLCPKGSWIILGLNDDIVDVMIMAQTNQVMHIQINIRVNNKVLFCSFIYVDNYYVDRHALWNNLAGHASLMQDKPWVLLGDFNVALNLEDHSCGGYKPNIAIREFKECVQKMDVMDVNATGLHFTWNQKPKGSNGILKKIDRIMCNIPFTNDFSGKVVVSAFVSHYEQFLGLEGTTTPLDDPRLFSLVLSDHKAEFMVSEVSDNEIKGALFYLGDDKAPSSYRFTAAFFKKYWDILGGKVMWIPLNIDLTTLLGVVANMNRFTQTTGETTIKNTISYAESNL